MQNTALLSAMPVEMKELADEKDIIGNQRDNNSTSDTQGLKAMEQNEMKPVVHLTSWPQTQTQDFAVFWFGSLRM